MGGSRVLAWDDCDNVRDLGHLAMADGRTTRPGAIVRADDLTRLTKQGRAEAFRHGIRSVIDLRFPNEPMLRSSQFDCLNVSLLDPDRPETAAILASLDPFHTYRLIVDACGDRFVSVLRAVARAPTGGVAIHCHAGRDRTGLVAAIILSLVDVSEATIASDYAMSDRSHLGEAPASVETMMRTLQYVRDTFGGVEAYLRRHGATNALLVELRVRLVPAS